MPWIPALPTDGARRYGPAADSDDCRPPAANSPALELVYVRSGPGMLRRPSAGGSRRHSAWEGDATGEKTAVIKQQK